MQGEPSAGGELYRLAAFTTTPSGGNPAGVWIGDRLPDVETMQRIAASVGYSETAFIAPASGRTRTVRYYSPLAEVPFCGHATIASGVLLGEHHGAGRFVLQATVGDVVLDVRTSGGLSEAALTSVTPSHKSVTPALLHDVLRILGWDPHDLEPAIAPAMAFAGAWHLVLAARHAQRLATLTYDFERLKTTMLAANLTTLQLVWRESANVYHARNPFPVGGVVEDPATGAAAAAFGGYLRDAGLIDVPASILIHQGRAMGRPSLINVDIPPSGGIIVRGNAVAMAVPPRLEGRAT